MPKINRTNTKGLIQETGSGAVGVPFTETVTLTANAGNTAYVSAAGMPQLAGTLIKKVTVVTTTAAAFDAGNCGIRIGTAAAGTQIMALDADSLATGGDKDALALGRGSSTSAELATILGGTTLVAVPGSPYTATARTLFPEVVPSAGAITAGELQVTVEFLGA